MEPNKEQIQWFWEQCGFRYIPLLLHGTVPVETWLYPDGITMNPLPPTDLNNLFKYAVPKLDYLEIHGGLKGEHTLITVKVEQFKEANEYWGEDNKDSALALFWACYKAFGGKQ